MMKYIVVLAFCLAVVSADRNRDHRRRANANSNGDDSHNQAEEARWFSVQPSSSFWSRTVFRLKNSNVADCERKCISFKGACMSFDFHKRTGTCYGRPEGAVIFETQDQRDRIHNSNHYNFYYISHDDLLDATREWEFESPEEAADATREEEEQAAYERERQEQEQERQRARQRHQEMLEERQRRIEFRKQQEAERQRQQQNRQPEPEPEIIEAVVPAWNRPERTGGKYYEHDPDFTCISGVKSFAAGRLMSDTTTEEKCVIRDYSTPHQCYQLSLEMTMNTAGVEVQTSSYTGGCYYPELKQHLDQGRDSAADSLPDDMDLDFYGFATCDQKNCFDLTQSVEDEEEGDDVFEFEPDYLCPLHGCTPERIGCRGSGLKKDDNGCTLCECEEEDHQCPSNQVWDDCGTACPLRCGEDRPEFCTYNCVIGCACPRNMWLTDDGDCVREEQCPQNNIPERDNYPRIPDYPSQSCPLHGCTPERIGCNGAELKRDENGCTLCECEDYNPGDYQEECPHNQVYLQCGTACQDECGKERSPICTANCVAGCQCPLGLWKTEEGYCVEQSDCPRQEDDYASPDNFNNQECYEAVGMKDGSLSDDQFSASSAYWGYPAHYARLDSKNAWAPQITQEGEYLEIDFGKRINVVGVATQGKKYYFQDTYITKYNLEYMDRRGNWVFYNNEQEFEGNTDADTVKQNFFFQNPIHTRRLRIVVNDWEQQILMRAEVYSQC